MIDWLGWLGNLLLITGAWRLANKHRHAFLFSIAGGCCWLHEAVVVGRMDWLFIEIVMLGIGIRNYWMWGKTCNTSK